MGGCLILCTLFLPFATAETVSVPVQGLHYIAYTTKRPLSSNFEDIPLTITTSRPVEYKPAVTDRKNRELAPYPVMYGYLKPSSIPSKKKSNILKKTTMKRGKNKVFSKNGSSGDYSFFSHLFSKPRKAVAQVFPSNSREESISSESSVPTGKTPNVTVTRASSVLAVGSVKSTQTQITGKRVKSTQVPLSRVDFESTEVILSTTASVIRVKPTVASITTVQPVEAQVTKIASTKVPITMNNSEEERTSKQNSEHMQMILIQNREVSVTNTDTDGEAILGIDNAKAETTDIVKDNDELNEVFIELSSAGRNIRQFDINELGLYDDIDMEVTSEMPSDASVKSFRMGDKSYDQFEPSKSLLARTDYGGFNSANNDNSDRMFRKVERQQPVYCHMEKQTEFVDKCESYMEETCHFLNREICELGELTNCSIPVQLRKVEEVCLNMPDRFCTLVEQEEKVVEEVLVMEEICGTEVAQVCDQIYKVEIMDVEEELCVEMEHYVCSPRDNLLSDTNCTEVVEYECHDDNGEQNDKSFCDKIEKYSCVTTPAEVVHMHWCEPLSIFCQNITSQHARPVMEEICHKKLITNCSMVDKVKPVVRRHFTYTEFCKKIPSLRCKMIEKIKLEPRCSIHSRPVCHHNIELDRCEEDDKEYCYQVAMTKEVEVCDDVFHTEEV